MHHTTASVSYPYFMSHPFWDALRIQPHSSTLQSLRALDEGQLFEFVQTAVRGFYPISYASLQAFRRFSELADDPEAKAIAHEIYLVEKGEKPLIPGSAMQGVLHCDQLKFMFQSLLDKPLDLPEPEQFEVLQTADIDNASIVKSMAICDVIENTARQIPPSASNTGVRSRAAGFCWFSGCAFSSTKSAYARDLES